MPMTLAANAITLIGMVVNIVFSLILVSFNYPYILGNQVIFIVVAAVFVRIIVPLLVGKFVSFAFSANIYMDDAGAFLGVFWRGILRVLLPNFRCD